MTHICFSDQNICKNICLLPSMTFDFKPRKIQNRKVKSLVFSLTWQMTNFLLLWPVLSTFVFTLITHRRVAPLPSKIQTCSKKIFSLKEQQGQQIQNVIFLIPLLIPLQIHPALIWASHFFVHLLLSDSEFFKGTPAI